MSQVSWRTVVACLVAMAVGASFYVWKMGLWRPAMRPSPHGEFVVVDVSHGESVGDAARRAGVSIDDNDRNVVARAGSYRVSAALTGAELAAALRSGRQPEHSFTVPEGLRKEEVAAILSKAGFGATEDIVDFMNDPALIREFGVPDGVDGGIDGYLFPDTWRFAADVDVLTILRAMRARLDEVVDARMRLRMAALRWSLHQTLTLAAIVEKETADPAERPHISRVFHNRLKQGMRLQTDPTVLYAMPEHQPPIKKSDLARVHPYNTYVITGLPPGPIANPGKAALTAALFPSDDEAAAADVYFVAKGDSGRHEFCADLACHNAAVARWLR